MSADQGRAALREYAELDKAFDRVRVGLLERIASTKLGEADVREQLYLSIGALTLVREALLTAASDATMDEHQKTLQKVMQNG